MAVWRNQESIKSGHRRVMEEFENQSYSDLIQQEVNVVAPKISELRDDLRKISLEFS